MRRILARIRIWLDVVVESLNRYLYLGIACQHFCLFKGAGSNFKHAHVHILGTGPGVPNPDGYTGLGHDDATPGMSNPGDDKHNTVSRGGTCEFRPSPGDRSHALMPIDLRARMITTAYFHPAPEDGPCARGFTRMQCECGDMCVTFNRGSFEEWQRTQ